MIKVSDYIFERLHKVHGVNHIFLITGGGAMHLNDSVGRVKGLQYICNHHEQACAIAAEGYARVTNKLAAVSVTTGPGGTNAITGILGQWTDSVPVIYIVGQVKFETTLASVPNLGLRQLGDQEINAVDIVRPITKLAVMVIDKLDIKKYLDKAVYFATHGRPGPVWLEIPMDVQGAMVEEKFLRDYDPSEDDFSFDKQRVIGQINLLTDWLMASKRPIIVAGNGIRIANAKSLLLDFVEKHKIPVLSTFNGFDLISSIHPMAVGRIGTIGDRAGNFALQNSDLVITVGSRNNIRQVSYNWGMFARGGKKVVVDIDPAELKKPTLKSDLQICSDAKFFLQEFDRKLLANHLPDWREWNVWCQERKHKYPVVLPEYSDDKKGVNPYYFIKALTENLAEESVVVAGDGTAIVTLLQASVVKKEQRMFSNSGCAAMGYDLPAAIGACFGIGGKDVVCLAGDGSLQLNLQELQTVVHYRLPIKIFYLNNDGYISIKQTQDNFFSGRHVGSGPNSGVSFPDIKKIGEAYGLSVLELVSHKDLNENIRKVLNTRGPVICEVKLETDYRFSPKLSSLKLPDGKMISKPLEDLYPFLDREEFKSNMIILPLEE